MSGCNLRVWMSKKRAQHGQLRSFFFSRSFIKKSTGPTFQSVGYRLHIDIINNNINNQTCTTKLQCLFINIFSTVKLIYWHNNKKKNKKKLNQAVETADSPLDMYWRLSVWMMHKSVSCTEENHGRSHKRSHLKSPQIWGKTEARRRCKKSSGRQLAPSPSLNSVGTWHDDQDQEKHNTTKQLKSTQSLSPWCRRGHSELFIT